MFVYVDDATGKLMELRFVPSESAFDYSRSTLAYVKRHGRPIAFYSDKHSIFRVQAEGATGRSHEMSQVGRALAQLNIDIFECAGLFTDHAVEVRLTPRLKVSEVCLSG